MAEIVVISGTALTPKAIYGHWAVLKMNLRLAASDSVIFIK